MPYLSVFKFPAVLCWTTGKMSPPDVEDTITICTAFAVRPQGSATCGGITALFTHLRAPFWRSSKTTASTWLPIWQFDSLTHTSSLWKYGSAEDAAPLACHTWTGISSLEHAQDLLKQPPVRTNLAPYLPYFLYRTSQSSSAVAKKDMTL